MLDRKCWKTTCHKIWDIFHFFNYIKISIKKPMFETKISPTLRSRALLRNQWNKLHRGLGHTWIPVWSLRTSSEPQNSAECRSRGESMENLHQVYSSPEQLHKNRAGAQLHLILNQENWARKIAGSLYYQTGRSMMDQ